jgi:hypothetical protein
VPPPPAALPSQINDTAESTFDREISIAKTFQFEVLYQIRGMIDALSWYFLNEDPDIKADLKDPRLYKLVDTVSDIGRLLNICSQSVLETHPGSQGPPPSQHPFKINSRPKAGTLRFVLCYDVLYQLRGCAQQTSSLISPGLEHINVGMLDALTRVYISKLIKKLVAASKSLNVIIQNSTPPTKETTPSATKLSTTKLSTSKKVSVKPDAYSSDTFTSASSSSSYSSSSSSSSSIASLPFSPAGAVISSPVKLVSK